jgi:hypothetical protein
MKSKSAVATGRGISSYIEIKSISETAAHLVNHEVKTDIAHHDNSALPKSSQSSVRGQRNSMTATTTARSALSAAPKLHSQASHSSSSSSSSSSHTASASTRLSTSTGVTLSLELDREAVRRILAHSSLLSEAKGLGANLAAQHRSAEASLIALHTKATKDATLTEEETQTLLQAMREKLAKQQIEPINQLISLLLRLRASSLSVVEAIVAWRAVQHELIKARCLIKESTHAALPPAFQRLLANAAEVVVASHDEQNGDENGTIDAHSIGGGGGGMQSRQSRRARFTDGSVPGSSPNSSSHSSSSSSSSSSSGVGLNSTSTEVDGLGPVFSVSSAIAAAVSSSPEFATSLRDGLSEYAKGSRSDASGFARALGESLTQVPVYTFGGSDYLGSLVTSLDFLQGVAPMVDFLGVPPSTLLLNPFMSPSNLKSRSEAFVEALLAGKAAATQYESNQSAAAATTTVPGGGSVGNVNMMSPTPKNPQQAAAVAAALQRPGAPSSATGRGGRGRGGTASSSSQQLRPPTGGLGDEDEDNVKTSSHPDGLGSARAGSGGIARSGSGRASAGREIPIRVTSARDVSSMANGGGVVEEVEEEGEDDYADDDFGGGYDDDDFDEEEKKGDESPSGRKNQAAPTVQSEITTTSATSAATQSSFLSSSASDVNTTPALSVLANSAGNNLRVDVDVGVPPEGRGYVAAVLHLLGQSDSELIRSVGRALGPSMSTLSPTSLSALLNAGDDLGSIEARVASAERVILHHASLMTGDVALQAALHAHAILPLSAASFVTNEPAAALYGIKKALQTGNVDDSNRKLVSAMITLNKSPQQRNQSTTESGSVPSAPVASSSRPSSHAGGGGRDSQSRGSSRSGSSSSPSRSSRNGGRGGGGSASAAGKEAREKEQYAGMIALVSHLAAISNVDLASPSTMLSPIKFSAAAAAAASLSSTHLESPRSQTATKLDGKRSSSSSSPSTSKSPSRRRGTAPPSVLHNAISDPAVASSSSSSHPHSSKQGSSNGNSKVNNSQQSSTGPSPYAVIDRHAFELLGVDADDFASSPHHHHQQQQQLRAGSASYPRSLSSSGTSVAGGGVSAARAKRIGSAIVGGGGAGTSKRNNSQHQHQAVVIGAGPSAGNAYTYTTALLTQNVGILSGLNPTDSPVDASLAVGASIGGSSTSKGVSGRASSRSASAAVEEYGFVMQSGGDENYVDDASVSASIVSRKTTNTSSLPSSSSASVAASTALLRAQRIASSTSPPPKRSNTAAAGVSRASRGGGGGRDGSESVATSRSTKSGGPSGRQAASATLKDNRTGSANPSAQLPQIHHKSSSGGASVAGGSSASSAVTSRSHAARASSAHNSSSVGAEQGLSSKAGSTLSARRNKGSSKTETAFSLTNTLSDAWQVTRSVYTNNGRLTAAYETRIAKQIAVLEMRSALAIGSGEDGSPRTVPYPSSQHHSRHSSSPKGHHQKSPRKSSSSPSNKSSTSRMSYDETAAAILASNAYELSAVPNEVSYEDTSSSSTQRSSFGGDPHLHKTGTVDEVVEEDEEDAYGDDGFDTPAAQVLDPDVERAMREQELHMEEEAKRLAAERDAAYKRAEEEKARIRQERRKTERELKSRANTIADEVLESAIQELSLMETTVSSLELLLIQASGVSSIEEKLRIMNLSSSLEEFLLIAEGAIDNLNPPPPTSSIPSAPRAQIDTKATLDELESELLVASGKTIVDTSSASTTNIASSSAPKTPSKSSSSSTSTPRVPSASSKSRATTPSLKKLVSIGASSSSSTPSRASTPLKSLTAKATSSATKANNFKTSARSLPGKYVEAKVNEIEVRSKSQSK